MDQTVLKRMREDWDARARENAQYYIANSTRDWDEREFFRTGEINVANEVMPDMHRICGGARSPRDLRMLEIGCGVGRMTKAFANLFGHVTAFDVSAEMVAGARANLASLGNVEVMLGDGATLGGVPDASHDFAFSYIVFQHIPSAEVIESYCKEVNRVLKPGSLFKVQVNGAFWEGRGAPDTWEGVSFTEEDAKKLAKNSGFVLESSDGAGTQYFWLWLRKP
jgi:ubiquinone/menaquinone biosynthesis C-methylase UbiE